MAAKKITVNGAAGDRPTGTANAATGVAEGARQTGAAGAVWDALTTTPDATVSAIVDASGVSRATVARTLATLEREGRAARTRGAHDGGQRQPDTWHPVTITTGHDTIAGGTSDGCPAEVPEGEGGAAHGAPATIDTSAAPELEGTESASTGTDARDTNAGAESMDAAALADAREALTSLQDAITAALVALDGGDGAGALTAVDGVYGGSGKARRLVRAAANGRPRTASGTPRSAPGEMRAKVAAHLSGHPGSPFTPHEIAKVIGHSAGAVSNALDRLTEAGEAELVCDRPRRFTGTSTANSTR